MTEALVKEILSSQKFLTEIIDIINDCVILTNTSGKIYFFNKTAEDLFDYKVDDIEGKNLSVLFTDKDREYYYPNIIKLTLMNKGFTGELLLQKKNREKIPVYMTTHYCGGKEWSYNGLIIITINNITRIKELEKNYRKSEKLAFIGTLTHGLVHEIRNPLVSLIGFAHRICKDMKNDNPNRLYIDIINSEAKRLENLLVYLEDFANLPQPVYKLEHLGNILESVVETIRKDAEQKKVAINLNNDYLNAEPDIFLDAKLMEKAFSAVIINAIEAISHSGTIDCTIKSNGHYIDVVIVDSGTGIPGNYLDSMFEPFFTMKQGHIGLSLTTVKRIIEDQGGYIEVESKVGAGTIFHLRLLKDRRTELRSRDV